MKKIDFYKYADNKNMTLKKSYIDNSKSTNFKIINDEKKNFHNILKNID